MRVPTIEWMCTKCGRKESRSQLLGRPQPGVCPRSLIKGRPHRWVKNRIFGKQ